MKPGLFCNPNTVRKVISTQSPVQATSTNRVLLETTKMKLASKNGCLLLVKGLYYLPNCAYKKHCHSILQPKIEATVIIGEGSERDRNSIGLSTKRGNYIHNTQFQSEQVPEMIQAKMEMHESFVQQTQTQLRSIDSSYNCVGLIFASRRTRIEPNLVRWILQEDGYKPIDEQHTMVDDLVIYTLNKDEVVHIGRLIDKVLDEATNEYQWRILSKWGKDGEYLHKIKDVPQYLSYDGLEFWSEKERGNL